MGKVISFFYHKGGVGKTTTIHNLSYELADQGQKVLVIDADPQMNLTSSMYGLAINTVYIDKPQTDLFDLASFDSAEIEYEYDAEKEKSELENKRSRWQKNQNRYVSFYDFIQEKLFGKSNLRDKNNQYFRYKSTKNSVGYVDLLAGDIRLSEFEFEFYSYVVNHNLQSSQAFVKKLWAVLRELGQSYDFIIIDNMPSSSSMMVGFLVLTADYFIAPVMPTFYSLQAIDNLTNIIKHWESNFVHFEETYNVSGIEFKVKFLGMVVQQAKLYKGTAQSSQIWIDYLNDSLHGYMQFARKVNRIIEEDDFCSIFQKQRDNKRPNPYIIEMCYDFTGKLRHIAEEIGIPVIHLNKDNCAKYKVRVIRKVKDSEERKAEEIPILDSVGYGRNIQETCDSYQRIAENLIKNLK